jgi:hypothetical protein
MQAKIVLMALILLQTACGARPERAVAPADDVAALRDLKLVLWPRAYREQNTTLLEGLLADDFVVIDGKGTISTKQQELDWVAHNRPGYSTFRYTIERINVYDGVSAIIAGLGEIQFDDEKGPRTVRYRSTNVLVKQAGRWRAVASHVSMVPD